MILLDPTPAGRGAAFAAPTREAHETASGPSGHVPLNRTERKSRFRPGGRPENLRHRPAERPAQPSVTFVERHRNLPQARVEEHAAQLGPASNAANSAQTESATTVSVSDHSRVRDDHAHGAGRPRKRRGHHTN